MSIAPIEPIDQPEFAGPASSNRSVPLAMELLFAVIAAVVVAALGAPIGLLWSKIAPHVELIQTDYGPYPIDGEPEGYWADDGWFIILAIVVGALVAVAAWLLLRRYRGPLMLVGLVVGSAGASVLAAWLGNKIGYAHYLDLAQNAPKDTHIFRPVKLRTGTSSLAFGFIPWVRGTMLVQAIAAAVVYTGLAGFHVSPTLRYETMPPEYFDPEPRPAPDPAAPGPAAPDESAPNPAVSGPMAPGPAAPDQSVSGPAVPGPAVPGPAAPDSSVSGPGDHGPTGAGAPADLRRFDLQAYPAVAEGSQPSPNGRHAADPAAGHPPARDPDQR